MASNAHVALNTLFYDGWILKFSEGYTGRANSVSKLYPSTKPIEEKVAYCEEVYKKQELPCQFKLIDSDKDFYDFLVKRGYAVVTPTDIMTLDLRSKMPLQDLNEDSKIEYVFSSSEKDWLPIFYKIHEIDDLHDQDVFKRMLAKVLVQTIYCRLLYEGKPAACASAAIEDSCMLLQNVVVAPEFRGLGLGKKLCQGLLEKAYKDGAHYSYLQVVQTNTIAVNLYKKLGFEKLCSYWYMKK